MATLTQSLAVAGVWQSGSSGWRQWLVAVPSVAVAVAVAGSGSVAGSGWVAVAVAE
jgi:hypothetical protein